MGTHAIIGYEKDGVVTSIYLHFDGYYEHAGVTLETHYNSQELAEKLVSGGDLSALYASCEKPEGHTFKTPVEGFCIYYGRDRGETGVAPKKHSSTEFFYKYRGEIRYVFRNGAWHFYRDA